MVFGKKVWVFEVCTVGDYGKHRRVIVEVPNCGVTEVKPEGQSFKSSFFKKCFFHAKIMICFYVIMFLKIHFLML